ncbi:MAG: MarR family transcriptional regulator [Acidimicrobiales bacterium]|nr:MarR family transcriptional regulator [Acidimicrobiales bacterium]
MGSTLVVPHEYDPEAVKAAEADIRQRLSGKPVDMEVQYAISNLYRAATVVSRSAEREVFLPEELSWSAFSVLWVLWVFGEMDSSRLAAELGITQGTVTGVRKGLEKQGLVRSGADPTDGRRRTISLTDAGAAKMERIYPGFNSLMCDLLGDLEPDEINLLAKLLHSVIVRPAKMQP